MAYDGIEFVKESGGAKLFEGDDEGGDVVAESRLLRGPVEELEAGERVLLEGECLGEIFGCESWGKLGEGLFEL